MKGFTLIEFLLYIALVGVVFTIGLEISLNVLFARTKARSIAVVAENARLTLDAITQETRNAQRVTSPSRGVNSSSLSLNTAVAENNPTVFSLSAGTLMMSKGTAPAAALTSPLVEVSLLGFQNVSYAGAPDAIRITFTLAFRNPANRPEFTYQESFFTTVTVRRP